MQGALSGGFAVVQVEDNRNLNQYWGSQCGEEGTSRGRAMAQVWRLDMKRPICFQSMYLLSSKVTLSSNQINKGLKCYEKD